MTLNPHASNRRTISREEPRVSSHESASSEMVVRSATTRAHLPPRVRDALGYPISCRALDGQIEVTFALAPLFERHVLDLVDVQVRALELELVRAALERQTRRRACVDPYRRRRPTAPTRGTNRQSADNAALGAATFTEIPRSLSLSDGSDSPARFGDGRDRPRVGPPTRAGETRRPPTARGERACRPRRARSRRRRRERAGRRRPRPRAQAPAAALRAGRSGGATADDDRDRAEVANAERAAPRAPRRSPCRRITHLTSVRHAVRDALRVRSARGCARTARCWSRGSRRPCPTAASRPGVRLVGRVHHQRLVAPSSRADVRQGVPLAASDTVQRRWTANSATDGNRSRLFLASARETTFSTSGGRSGPIRARRNRRSHARPGTRSTPVCRRRTPARRSASRKPSPPARTGPTQRRPRSSFPRPARGTCRAASP